MFEYIKWFFSSQGEVKFHPKVQIKHYEAHSIVVPNGTCNIV